MMRNVDLDGHIFIFREKQERKLNINLFKISYLNQSTIIIKKIKQIIKLFKIKIITHLIIYLRNKSKTKKYFQKRKLWKT